MAVSIANILGHGGAALLVLCYFGSSLVGPCHVPSIYHIGNFFGAAGIAYSSLRARNTPSVWLNIFWCGVAALNAASVLFAT